MTVVLVAALADGQVIGRDGGLPWHLPEDLAHFRELTLGHPVVMGRRTWESLPPRFRPLPERRNIVLTRDPAWRAEGAERASSLAEALSLASGAERVCVIGGGEVFAEALAFADELHLTELALAVEGDAWFPPFRDAGFREVERRERIAANGTCFAFVTYAR